MPQESSVTMPLVFLSIYNRAQRKRVNILLLEITLLTLCMGCVATGKLCVFAVLGCLLIAVVLVSLVPYFIGLFNCLYLSQFLTDFGQILDYKSYDQY